MCLSSKMSKFPQGSSQTATQGERMIGQSVFPMMAEHSPGTKQWQAQSKGTLRRIPTGVLRFPTGHTEKVSHRAHRDGFPQGRHTEKVSQGAGGSTLESWGSMWTSDCDTSTSAECRLKTIHASADRYRQNIPSQWWLQWRLQPYSNITSPIYDQHTHTSKPSVRNWKRSLDPRNRTWRAMKAKPRKVLTSSSCKPFTQQKKQHGEETPGEKEEIAASCLSGKTFVSEICQELQ